MSPTTPSHSNPAPLSGPERAKRLRGDRRTATLAALAALAVYVPFLPKTVTGEDAGELVAAAVTWGIPHPPGYPLWTLLAGGAVHGLPVATEVWRAALVSAVFASGTVWIVARAVLALSGSRIGGLAAGLTLAVSYEFWEQSVIPEVYTLNAFLLAAAFYTAIHWRRAPKTRTLYALAFFSGLAATHYVLSVFYLPLFAVFVLLTDPTPRRWKHYVGAAALALSTTVIYLYLPLRSAADPAMDWGNPETPARFLDVVSRDQYSHLVADAPRSPAVFLQRMGVFLNLAAWQFTPWAALLAAPGLLLAFRLTRSVGWLLSAGALVAVLTPLVIPGFRLEYHWIWLNTPYWIPAYVVTGLLLGLGVAWTQQRLRVLPWLPAVVAAIAVASPLLWHLRSFAQRDTTLVDAYGRALLESLAPDALYVGSGDYDTFPLVYLQIVEGLRPDVILANRYGYADDRFYEAVGEAPPEHRPGSQELDRLFRVVQTKTDRPVYSAARRSPAGTRTRVNAGLAYRYVSENDPGELAAPSLSIPDLPPARTGGDWTLELIHYAYRHAAARAAFAEGAEETGIVYLRQAAAWLHNDKHGLNALGITAAEAGQIEAAAAFFERALAQDPAQAAIRVNLSQTYRILNRPGDALHLIEDGLRIHPDHPALEREKERALKAVEASNAR